MRGFFRLTITTVAIIVCIVVGLAGNGQAYTGKLQIPADGANQKITLTDGSTLVGRVTDIKESEIKFQTDLGEMTIATEKIKSIEDMPPEITFDERGWFPNPNRTRLLIGPTARTMEAGNGYFYDLWIFFPGLAYAVTDNFMISGGASLIPDADDQMFYIIPKYGFPVSPKMDLAANLMICRLWEETFYLAFGSATYGTADLSLTGGLGLAFTDDAMAENPLAMLGGEYRLAQRVSLVVETWFVPGDNDNGMIGLGGLRLMGEKMTIDVGIGLSYDDNNKDNSDPYYDNLDDDDDTQWLPYIDFVWNF